MKAKHHAAAWSLNPILVLAAVTLLTVMVKLGLSLQVEHSGHFAEDYGYLNKARYYLNLDFAVSSRSLGSHAAGILYSIVVSPWMLVPNNALQFPVVIAINSLLSAGTIVLATLAVWDAARTRSLAVPFIFAAMPPVFLFNFYALTENLMLCLAAAAAWLCTKVPRDDSGYWPDIVLVAVIVASPLARPPGLAVLLGVVATVLALWPKIATARRYLYLLVAPLLTISIYGAIQFTPVDYFEQAGSREEVYLLSLRQIFGTEGSLVTLAKLTLSQIAYIGLATLFLPFACAIWGLIEFAKAPKVGAPERASLTVFCSVAAALFVAFCIAHLVLKLSLDPNRADFVYGRYDDPAVVLVMMAGLAVMTSRVEPARQLVFGIAAILIIVAAIRFFSSSGFSWGTVNQTGLLLFWRYQIPAFAVVFSLAILLLFLPRSAAYAGYVVFALAVYVATDVIGYQNALYRSQRIAQDVAGADWIENHVPATDCVGLDGRHVREKAVGMKYVDAVYRAITFLVYPRKVEIEKRPDVRPGSCRYFFTTRKSIVPAAWQQVWADDHYAVYLR